MIKPEYLIRFDDICPTMDWAYWRQIEHLLDENEVKPIVAIIADNRDKHFQQSKANPAFWDEVRGWQRKGWTIGMHGFQHEFHTQNSGIIGLHKRSEFAGLSIEKQRQKIKNAQRIFDEQNVRIDCFAAPAHSLDEITVQVLIEAGISVVSDGFNLYPHLDDLGMLWIPQQIWKFHWFPLGVWTVCCHHNDWNKTKLSEFSRDLRRFKNYISITDQIRKKYYNRRPVWHDSLFSYCYLKLLKFR